MLVQMLTLRLARRLKPIYSDNARASGMRLNRAGVLTMCLLGLVAIANFGRKYLNSWCRRVGLNY